MGISRGAPCTDGDEVLENNCWDGPPEPPCDVASCAFAHLSVTFAPGAPQTIWKCRFDKFPWPYSRDAQGVGDFAGDVRAYYQSGETVAGTCQFSAHYQDQRFNYAFP